MSSGHTWHWGTLERSHQIPLGKPGLVIPRCKILASRSVTFPLHQREVQHRNPRLPLLSTRICNWGSRGEKSAYRRKGSTLATPPNTPQQQQNSKDGGRKKDQRLSILLRELLHGLRDSSNTAGWWSPTHLHTQVKALHCITAPSTIHNHRQAVVFYLFNQAFMSLFKGF